KNFPRLKWQLNQSESENSEGDVRLSGSSSPSEGRVEIYHQGQWGSVCDDDWDLSDAQVVCRQLNFQGAIDAVTKARYGQGTLFFQSCALDDVGCSGQEQKLVSCRSSGWGVNNCGHQEDAGVICDPQSMLTLVLKNTTLSEDLGIIYDSGTACDFLITFQTSNGTKQEDGTPEETTNTICAHKAILMLYPYFSASVGENNITVSVNTTCQSYSTSIIRYAEPNLCLCVYSVST
uniref:SRCR domain-containing protein n=1 Tax=Poecilia mexicana TaxID=48701 RepID=A0A3B3XCK8_9TELE